MQNKHLILGYGEVGQAIYKIVKGSYIIDFNVDNYRCEPVDFIHICIPYTKDFNEIVEQYKELGLVICHSTVPIGTCDKLGIVHSPIRGVHPHLEKGIRIFPKYFGGKRAKEAAKMFKELGLKVKVFKDAKTTEALKLWDTTQYGRLIMLEKEIYIWCKKNKIDFDAIYTQANKDYNEGYIKLGRPEVVRPYLKHIEGKIGGHCILPNAKLLEVKL